MFTSEDVAAAASAIGYKAMEDSKLNAILAVLSTSSLYNQHIQTFIDSQVTRV